MNALQVLLSLHAALLDFSEPRVRPTLFELRLSHSLLQCFLFQLHSSPSSYHIHHIRHSDLSAHAFLIAEDT